MTVGDTARPAAGRYTILLAALVFGMDAWGATTELTPSFQAGVVHETNPRLASNDENEATGLVLDGRLKLERRTPKSSLNFSPRLVLSRYPDDEDRDLEDDDIYLDLTYSRFGPTWQWATLVSYRDISIRESELASASDPGGGSGNLRFANDTQRNLTISPSWFYFLTPLTTLRLNASYTDVEYDRDDSGRIPYDVVSGDLSLERTFNPKTTAGITLAGSRFESEEPNTDTQNESETYGLTLFMTYDFTETITGAISVGGRETDQTLDRRSLAFLPPDNSPVCVALSGAVVPCSESFSGSNFVGSANLSKESLLTTYDIGVSRFITPNSNGTETIRDTFTASIDRELGENLNLNFGAIYFQQEDVTGLINRDRDYWRFDVRLRWKLSPRWSLTPAYRYINDQDDGLSQLPNSGRDADNHYFGLSIAYSSQGWRW